MATREHRDEVELGEGVTRWIRSREDLVPGVSGPAGGAVPEVTGVTHAEGGLANETIMIELGPAHQGIVLRLPPLEPTFPAYDLSCQAVLQNALARAAIPAPAPAVYVADPQWIGTPFLAMPKVSGFIPGPAPIFDPAIIAASPERQRKYHDGFIDTLACLHAVDWRAGELGAVLPGQTVSAALDRWSAYVDWAGEGRPLPVLTEALDWARRNQPPDRAEAVLLWGDPRLGNLVFDDEGHVHAVLDWDLAGLGPPEMDLGWYFGLDTMMEQLFGRRVPGFPVRAEAVAHYEERSGHAVIDLDWHEVFALLRALAINDRHQRMAARRRRRAGDRRGTGRRSENPMIPVLAARIARIEADGR